jgi:hypothetical protein
MRVTFSRSWSRPVVRPDDAIAKKWDLLVIAGGDFRMDV